MDDPPMNPADLTRMYDFTDRTIVVTGGTGVLCGAMARALAGCGANVVIVARDEKKGGDTVRSLKGPGRSIAVKCDVTVEETLHEACSVVVGEFGRIDGLINGAGGNSPRATTRPDQSFFGLPQEALRYVFDLNLMGTIVPCQVFAQQMALQKEGVILNISSMSAIRPLTRVIGYSAAKAGIDNFTRWLAVHMAQEYSPKIRVNAIAPGFFLGEQNRNMLVDPQSGELTPRGKSIIEHTPMRRFGDPEDLLGTVLWLMSPASAFVSGIVVPVDGGFSASAGI